MLTNTQVSSFNLVNKVEWTDQPRMKLLLSWARLVCAHYGVHVDNFSTAFSDGRALCYLVHHYHPGRNIQEAILRFSGFAKPIFHKMYIYLVYISIL